MNEQRARDAVVRAGLELVRSGLIVRTWGNVSCRLDDEYFAVTPSGRAYEGLSAADIVICRVSDASPNSGGKPSSEKGAHALLYRARKDIGFVIHTHQKYATAVASSGLAGIKDVKMGGIPVAAYGLPGTKKLIRGVEAALPRASGAMLMSHHGALCYGKTYEDAFDAALALEEVCERFMYERCGRAAAAEEYLRKIARGAPSLQADAPFRIRSSRRSGTGAIVITPKEGDDSSGRSAGLPKEADIHAAIYAARPDIYNIEVTDDENVRLVSLAKKPLPQLVDDFAQMTGKPMRISKSAAPDSAVKALGKTAGVMIAGAGALCCAATQGDAHAMRLVTEKNALAEVCAVLNGVSKPIHAAECAIMHRVYTKSYSKLAEEPQ